MNKMIDGITVLAIHEHYRPTIFSALVMLSICIGIFLYTLYQFKDKEGTAVLTFFAGVIVMVTYFVLAEHNVLPKQLEVKCSTEYEVTIDDSVRFKEFSNMYRIINIDGDIYTIKIEEE